MAICYIFVATTIVVTTIMENKNLVVKLLRTTAYVEEKLNAALKTKGLSLPQFNVLRILRGRNGKAANISNLQDQMIKPMSNTSRLVDKLIEKKWVHRQICPSNRRKVEIVITQKGLAALKSIDSLVVKAEEEITATLNAKDKDELFALLSLWDPNK